jgi:chemotaxis protein CheX
VRLPANLDFAAAKPLWLSLSALRGEALTIDAADVDRLGAPCLQVLLMCKAAWSEDGQPFQISAPSPALVSSLTVMGFDHNLEKVSA